MAACGTHSPHDTECMPRVANFTGQRPAVPYRGRSMDARMAESSGRCRTHLELVCSLGVERARDSNGCVGRVRGARAQPGGALPTARPWGHARSKKPRYSTFTTKTLVARAIHECVWNGGSEPSIPFMNRMVCECSHSIHECFANLSIQVTIHEW